MKFDCMRKFGEFDDLVDLQAAQLTMWAFFEKFNVWCCVKVHSTPIDYQVEHFKLWSCLEFFLNILKIGTIFQDPFVLHQQFHFQNFERKKKQQIDLKRMRQMRVNAGYHKSPNTRVTNS